MEDRIFNINPLNKKIFVVDDLLWENTASSLAKSIFGAPIQGINQKEAKS